MQNSCSSNYALLFFARGKNDEYSKKSFCVSSYANVVFWGSYDLCYWHLYPLCCTTFWSSYFVTLKMRKSLKALRTDNPNDPANGTRLVQQTSTTLPRITMQSNRLNADSKYIRGPKAYIRTTISVIKRPKNTNSA